MNQIEKNTVKAENQLNGKEHITYHGDDGIRILIAGNSITRHGASEDLGWHNDCGMAASCAENDFVHILMRRVREKRAARYCIAQVADWERNYKNPEEIMGMYRAARDFEADIIIVRFIENCNSLEFDREIFREKYEEFIEFLNKTEKANIILTTSFWKHPGDETIKKIANENSYSFVMLNDLGELDEMKAVGLFKHEGVAAHPGDLGMKNIADRIYEKMKKFI